MPSEAYGKTHTPRTALIVVKGSVVSDVASGSSNSEQDGQRDVRRAQATGAPPVANSTSRAVMAHESPTESSAIDPLSAVSHSRHPEWQEDRIVTKSGW